MVQKTPRGAWAVVALLFGFMLINFADKIVVGLAGVPIMRDLGLTHQQFGLVGSSFFFLYSISAVLVGFVANRVKTRWLLLTMAIVWSLVQFPMAGAVTLPMLVACRVVLGAGEGPAYPVALHAAYKWFPNEQRTLPTAIIAQGAAVGVLVAVPVLNWIIQRYSWNTAFLTLGFVGGVWAMLWVLFGNEGPLTSLSAKASASCAVRTPYSRLMVNATTLSVWIAGFGAFWGQSLLIAWFTPYLIQGLGFSQSQAAWISILPWATAPVVSVGAGWLSQRLVMRGASTDIARGLLSGTCVATGGLALIALAFVPGDAFKIAMIVIGFALPAVTYVMGHAMVSEYTPIDQRGGMMGIGNAVATSAGIVAPLMMGSFIQGAASPADGYGRGYLIAGLVCCLGGIIGAVVSRPQTECVRLADGGRGELVPVG